MATDDIKSEAKAAEVETPLQLLFKEFKTIRAAARYDDFEVWGVKLVDDEKDIPTCIVLQKYLNANDGNVAKATGAIVDTLQWRKIMKPSKLVDELHSQTKFAGLGYVTVFKDNAGLDQVVTWNIYGGVKDLKKTFGDLDEYVRNVFDSYHVLNS